METHAQETGCETDRLATSSRGSAARWRYARIRLATEHATEFVDITGRLQALVAATGIRVGLINLQTLHTTTAIVVNEHEPLLLDDFESTLENVAPAGAPYRHDDASLRTINMTVGERVNGHSHCRALLLGGSACLNVVHGEIQLGRWQRVFFAELDGPRERMLSAMIFGDARDDLAALPQRRARTDRSRHAGGSR